MSLPYLTISHNDGNLTGRGRLKFVQKKPPDALLMARTSPGVGSVDAWFSLKKLDSIMIFVVLWLDSWRLVSTTTSSGVIFEITQVEQGSRCYGMARSYLGQ